MKRLRRRSPPVLGINLVHEPYKQTALEQEPTLRALQAAGVGGSLYYTWQGQIHAPKADHDGAFRCDALTESGKLALSPM